MFKFVYSFSIIIFGLALGYIFQLLVNSQIIRPSLPIDRIRKLLQYIALLFLNPVAIVGAIWIVNIQNVRIAALPFLGLSALILGGFLALGAARLLHLEPRKTGAMYGCGSFTNISGLQRPLFYGTINAVFVPLGTIMLLASIGMALKFRRVRDYIRECTAVTVIKFVMVPLVVSSMALAIGFGNIDGGLPLKVVIILTAMPVAFNALIPPSIYDLDLDLANSCWFVTTASDVAAKGLGVRRALVMGQVLPGVPVWELGSETRYPGLAYIIFPGNVGAADALCDIRNRLRSL